MNSAPSIQSKLESFSYSGTHFSLNPDAELDLVTDLPGFNAENVAQTRASSVINQYSGYIEAREQRQLHYWFIESERSALGQLSVDEVPLFVWTNGGPGCSSLMGLLTEHGPFWVVNSEGDLKINEYSWHKEVHMLYLEQPYGVGFSVVDDDEKFVAGDRAAGEDFDAAVRSFLLRFPELQNNEVYLSAESFGGHYIPINTLIIMSNNEAGSEPLINLKGFLLGNPYTNAYENEFGMVEAWYGHGLFRSDWYDTWRGECWNNYDAVDSSFTCIAMYLMTYENIENDVDLYALDFNDCQNEWNSEQLNTDIQNETPKNKNVRGFIGHRRKSVKINKLLDMYPSEDEWDALLESGRKLESGEPHYSIYKQFEKRFGSRASLVKYGAASLAVASGVTVDTKGGRELLGLDTGFRYYSCANSYIRSYLNQEDVQTALNVKSTYWTLCNYKVNEAWPESDWDDEMQKYYQKILSKYPEMKIMIYSGDEDSVCAQQGTQYWLQRMEGWSTEGGRRWRPWDFEDQIGGYVAKFVDEETDERKLYFHTVRSAGHMVPACQPARALALLRKYLNHMEW